MSTTTKDASVKSARFGKDQPAHYCGKKGQSGAPKDNRNGLRHGLKAGKLPLNCKYIESQINSLRRQLEDALMEARGEVSLTDAATIQTVCKWERHGALALRWLRLEQENLKPVERLTFSREIARASAERDKSIACLDLDKRETITLSGYLEAK